MRPRRSPLPAALAPLVVLAAALLAPRPATATVVVAKTLDELTSEAEVIVHARVERVESRFDTGVRTIHTYTTLRVMETLKGPEDGPARITVRQLGGTAEGLTQLLPGDAKFTVNTEVIVFLNRNEKGLPVMHLTALAQAKYDVVLRADPAHPDLVERLVRPDPEAARLAYMARDKDGALRPAAPPRIDVTTLSTFLDRVRRAF
jgi:hypothetical protein